MRDRGARGTRPGSPWRRDTAVLAGGSALSGLLAYVVFALTTRGLGAVEAAPVSVLWSYWAFAAAAFTFPVQHWITRTVEARGEGAIRAALPRVAGVVTGLSLVAGIVSALVREDLFGRGDLWFPVLVVGTGIGAGLIGLTRGVLSGRRRFGRVAASLVVENGVRCLVAAALLVAGWDDAVWYGVALVAGNLAVLVWPSVFRLAPSVQPDHGSALAFLAGAGTGQLVNQTILVGGPVVLALAGGGAAEVTALFAALALFRAPYMLALGAMPRLTSGFTALVVGGQVAELRGAGRRIAVGGALLGVVGGVAGFALGPPLLRLVFGDDVVLGRLVSAVVAAGCAVAVPNLVLMVLALAEDRAGLAARGWLGATVAAGLAYVLLWSVKPLERTAWCFLIAEGVAFGLLLWVSRVVRHDGPLSEDP